MTTRVTVSVGHVPSVTRVAAQVHVAEVPVEAYGMPVVDAEQRRDDEKEAREEETAKEDK
jgi:hypothetical protein